MLDHLVHLSVASSVEIDFSSIRRGIIVAEGDYIACQTGIEGRFERGSTGAVGKDMVVPARRAGFTGS
jgi:hypothetical protein